MSARRADAAGIHRACHRTMLYHADVKLRRMRNGSVVKRKLLGRASIMR